MTATEVLDMVSLSGDWINPINRFQARIIVELRAAGVADGVIHQALTRVAEKYSDD